VLEGLAAEKPKKVTSSDIRVALEKRYCAPEWCLMHEVANGTGFSGKRYADCIAMNLFPSRGLAIHGLEIKVSRSDLTNELKNPNKADEIAQYCDLWYVVTPKGLTDDLELPLPWGVIELHETGLLRERKKAKPLDAKPLTRTFIAALARRISQLDAASISQLAEEKIKPERERLAKQVQELRDERDKYPHGMLERYTELKDGVERLEKALGFSIRDHWGGGLTEFCKAAELVRQCGINESYSGIKAVRRTLKSNLADIDKALTKLGISEDAA
jgi:hypothetical protein